MGHAVSATEEELDVAADGPQGVGSVVGVREEGVEQAPQPARLHIFGAEHGAHARRHPRVVRRSLVTTAVGAARTQGEEERWRRAALVGRWRGTPRGAPRGTPLVLAGSLHRPLHRTRARFAARKPEGRGSLRGVWLYVASALHAAHAAR